MEDIIKLVIDIKRLVRFFPRVNINDLLTNLLDDYLMILCESQDIERNTEFLRIIYTVLNKHYTNVLCRTPPQKKRILTCPPAPRSKRIRWIDIEN